MLSFIKKSIELKYLKNRYFKKNVKKIKKYNIILKYLKSKNSEHRRNLNLGKIYNNFSKKWYLSKKNNFKTILNFKYSNISVISSIEDNLMYVNLTNKIIENDINWFY